MKSYQCIEATTIVELEERITKSITLGYIPIGGVNVILSKHNIKGEQAIFRQSLYYSPDNETCVKQVNEQLELLKRVSETSVHPDGAPEEAVIDSELMEAINEYLRGDA